MNRLWRQSDKARSFHHCRHPERIWSDLQAWYHSPLGRLFVEQEQAGLDGVLGNLFGYHLLHVGFPDEPELLRSSRVRHQLRMQPDRASHADGKQLYATATALPLLSDSLDVVVLTHILEFSDDPHRVLREVERVLIPEGHVVILGFNPRSLWALRRLLPGGRQRVPGCGQFLSVTRLKDWLALLGFDIRQCDYYLYRPPLQQAGLLRRLGLLERLGSRLWPILGGGYLLVARKRVATLTPIRPRWRTRRRMASAGLVEPMPPSRRGVPCESDR